MTRFAANLTLLFTEVPFLERFAAARRAGFGLVECQFPYLAPHEEIAPLLRQHGLKMVLFNLPGGRTDQGERGIACLPDRTAEFEQGVEQALSYARSLDCTLLNCLAGRRPPDLDVETAWATLRHNVAGAARRCAEHGVRLLVEPVNTVDAPGYLLPGASDVARLLDEVGQLDGVDAGISFDAYHVQRAEGDVTARMRAEIHRIHHVQIADSPDRHQPGTGELDYRFLLGELDRLGYTGVVGLEYHPVPTTEDSLRDLRRTFAPHTEKAAP